MQNISRDISVFSVYILARIELKNYNVVSARRCSCVLCVVEEELEAYR